MTAEVASAAVLADPRGLVDLETLLRWAFAEQRAVARAEGADDEGRWLAAGGRSMFAGWATVLALGTRVDGRAGASDVHPDAALVARAVAQCSAPGLVRRHAFTGTRPDWHPGARPRLVPEVVNNAGRRVPRTVHDPARVRDWLPTRVEGLSRAGYQAPGKVKGPYLCTLELIDDPLVIGAARRDYADWHGAMAALCDVLMAADLRDWRVTGFRAPARPWASEGG